MIKRISLILLSLMLVISALTACGTDENSTLTKVTLNEVAHSIFYAPMYVAIEEGYFTEEGIDLELVTGFGADKTMTAVLSGEADIGFMGAEASIYAYNEGANDYVVNFAQLTQRAGNFLVAQEKNDNFKWEDLKNSYVLKNPLALYEVKEQKLDNFIDRVNLIINTMLNDYKVRLDNIKSSYVLKNPLATYEVKKEKLINLEKILNKLVVSKIDVSTHKYEVIINKLELLNETQFL